MTTTSTNTNLTLDHLTLERVKKAIDGIGPEPFREFMIKQGFKPEDGYCLILPDRLREQCGPFVPHYVKFSKIIENAFIFQTKLVR